MRVNLQLVQRKKTQTAVIKKEINKSNPFFSFFFCARTRQCLCGKQVIGSISFARLLPSSLFAVPISAPQWRETI